MSLEDFIKLARENVIKMFDEFKAERGDARLLIAGHPVTIVPTDGIVEMLFTSAKTFGDMGARVFTYLIGKGMGYKMAQHLISRFNLKDPMERIIHGALFFEAAGLGLVDLLKIDLTNGEPFILWESPNSVFAEAPLNESNEEVKPPLCYFCAGYSAGWCEASMGIRLDAGEVWCKAEKEREACRFIICKSEKLYREEINQENLKPATEYRDVIKLRI